MGKTHKRSLYIICTWKHPHSRGEDDNFTYYEQAHRETPPLTWGRRKGKESKAVYARNTPTHVGKTDDRMIILLHEQKHPHSRGEDLIGLRHLQGNLETPPLTWGRLSDRYIDTVLCGNTPTHVGKTCQDLSCTCNQKKHPHSRGEDMLSIQQN